MFFLDLARRSDTAVVLLAGEGIRMGPLTLDLPKGLVPVAKCEKAIGGLYSIFPDNPITNARLAKKMSRRTDFKGKLGLRIVYTRLPSTAAKAGFCISRGTIRGSTEIGWRPRYA